MAFGPSRSSHASTNGSRRWRNTASDISTVSTAWSAYGSSCQDSRSQGMPIEESACRIACALDAKRQDNSSRTNRKTLGTGLAVRLLRSFVIGDFAARPRLAPEETFLHQFKDRAPIFRDYLQPGKLPHHGEVDSTEAQPRDEDVDAISQGLIVERIDGMGYGFRTISMRPAIFHFGVSLVDGHLQWRMRHGERNELLPVLHARQASSHFQPLVERRRG